MWLCKADKEELAKLAEKVRVLEYEKLHRDYITQQDEINQRIREAVENRVHDSEVADKLILELRVKLAGYFKQVL